MYDEKNDEMSNREFCYSAVQISGGISVEHTCVRLREAEGRKQNAQRSDVRWAGEIAFLRSGKAGSRVKFMMRWTTLERKACKVTTFPGRNLKSPTHERSAFCLQPCASLLC